MNLNNEVKPLVLAACYWPLYSRFIDLFFQNSKLCQILNNLKKNMKIYMKHLIVKEQISKFRLGFKLASHRESSHSSIPKWQPDVLPHTHPAAATRATPLLHQLSLLSNSSPTKLQRGMPENDTHCVWLSKAVVSRVSCLLGRMWSQILETIAHNLDGH